MLKPEKLKALEASVEAEINAAMDFAEQSPFPKINELHTDVFAQ
jgi:TPP-dependent pyruvate/acetoin dehydrogenase alpha subunit